MERVMVSAMLMIVGVTCGCATSAQTTALGVGGVAYLGTRPSNEIEQIYYLGVFDPQDQVPPTIYRVTVRGQASALSSMRFASGWVPARAIDSLGERVDLDQTTGDIKFSGSDGSQIASLKVGRRLVMFGPEGFREAPADHRLAIVMGSNANEFFGAIDEALGAVAGVEQDQANEGLHRKLYEALTHVKDQRERLSAIATDVKVELAAKGGN